MADGRPRSIEAILRRFTLTAYAVLVATVSAALVVGYRAMSAWEGLVAGRVTSTVTAALERRASETAESLAERAYSTEAVGLLRRPSDEQMRRRFTDEESQFLDRRGHTFLLIVDAAHRAVFLWNRAGAGAPPPAIPGSLFTLMDSLGAVGGYVRSGTHAELIGGTPLRHADGTRAGGYLLLGAPLDSSFLAQLNTDLAVHLRVQLGASMSASPVPIAGGDSLRIRLPLVGLAGVHLGVVEATVDRHAQHAYIVWGRVSAVVVLLLGAFATWRMARQGRRLLVEPMLRTLREVETMAAGQNLHELTTPLEVAEWEVLRATFNQTVRSLAEFQRRYRELFARAADALFIIDPVDGRVIDANPATEGLTGHAADELIGRPLPSDLLSGALGKRLVRWKRPDGITLTWGVATSEIRFDGGTWLLASFRDLTGRETMAHVQKMEAVGSLAGGIAHDFNNLMGAVLSGVTAARQLVPAGAPVHAALEGIAHAGTRAAELTRQLLSFSRHDPLRLAPVDLAQALSAVGAICIRTFDRQIAIDAWAADGLPAVLGDAGEIEQTLLNLCINARDAMPRGGSLRIEAHRAFLDADEARAKGVSAAGTYVRVKVVDTGSGMTDAVKARLFEPYFTTKAPGQGTGLGLSLAYGLMRQLGGSIVVQSEVGAGTQVTLFFPALAERVDGAPEPPAAPVAGGERRASARSERPVILLVDDERALREMLRMVLDLSGFAVIEAVDGIDALVRFREHRANIRVVLLDVHLPGALSGADTLAQLRAIDPHLPVILCTGYVRDEELARMRMLSVDDVLIKPVDINALLIRLDELSATRSD